MNLTSSDLTTGDPETAKSRLTSRRTFLKGAAATGAVATMYAVPRFSSFGPKPAYASITGIPCLSYIDFDTIGSLSGGDVIGDNVFGPAPTFASFAGLQPWSAFGVTVDALLKNQSAFHTHGSMIFKSSNADGTPSFTGGDNDLKTPNPSGHASNTVPRFNILILSEDGDTGDPDDDMNGGVIVFQFGSPRKLNSIDLIDIDTNENGSSPDGAQTRISAYNKAANLGTTPGEPPAGDLIAEVNVPGVGDSSWQTVAFQASGVEELRIRFRFSGAISRIDFVCP